MLAIKTADNRWITWHINEHPIPKLQRVQIFQADGDELNLIHEAMCSYYDKQTGRIIPTDPGPNHD